MVSEWGKEAAQELIQNQVPLNDTLVKIAQNNDLNSDQIARLVEAANISTHLTVNSGDNKYPEFEVADIRKVASAMANQEDIIQELSHYDMAPGDFDFSLHEKVATFQEVEDTEVLPTFTENRVKQAFVGLANHYDDKLAEIEQDVYEGAEGLKQYVKQAVLDPDHQLASWTLFKSAALTVTSDEWKPITRAVLSEIDTELKSTCGPTIYKKASSYEFDLDSKAVLNFENEGIKKLANYLELVKTYAIAKEDRDSILTKMASLELNRLGLSEKVANKLTFMKAMTSPFKWAWQGATAKSKALRTAGVLAVPAAGAAAVGTAAYDAGRQNTLEQLAPMQKHKLPERYKRY